MDAEALIPSCEHQDHKIEKLNDFGEAAIKPEFLAKNHVRTLTLECVAKSDRVKFEQSDETDITKPNLSKGEKRKLKGKNKNRGPPFRAPAESTLCSQIADTTTGYNLKECHNSMCPYQHDIVNYLANKPPDIASTCYVYTIKGHCPRGITCRFGSQHLDHNGKNLVNEEVKRSWEARGDCYAMNSFREVQFKLRKRKYDFAQAEKALLEHDKAKMNRAIKTEETEEAKRIKLEDSQEGEGIKTEYSEEINIVKTEDTKELLKVANGEKRMGPVSDTDFIKLRNQESKNIDWTDLLYLSPLTTVGNLPFRRICKEYGADVTCGEMALATQLLRGSMAEWALTKRHQSETLFGVQVCGSNPSVMSRCAQLIQDETHSDFVDINLGCPIDMVYKQGAGSGLLKRERVLMSIVDTMQRVLDVPLTVKLRTGVHSDKNVAHNLMPGFSKANVSLITVHGRSREQRYTRSADWAYIEKCALAAAPTPVFGNGDILSYEDYNKARANCPSISGCMIGRGALMKPWIFTEITEQRHWDISSTERLELLKRYVNYGLEHWGSDNKGVENTRRFLLEWLSFLYRYIPVGLLVQPPQKINQRHPPFEGRDQLETLLASPNCADWIRISEILLGKVPAGFSFLPKHKANSWK